MANPEELVLKTETIRIDVEMSLAKISLSGVNRPIINHRSTMLYHILSGEGMMSFNGGVRRLEPGVIVEIPPNTPYLDWGHGLEMESVSIPPFDQSDVEYLD